MPTGEGLNLRLYLQWYWVLKGGNLRAVERIGHSLVPLRYFRFETEICDKYDKINTAPVKQGNTFYINTCLTLRKLNPLREMLYW